MVPLLNVISSDAKSELDSFKVNVKAMDASLDELPSVTPVVVLEIIIVGPTLS